MDTRQSQINSLLKSVTSIQEKYNNNYEVLWYDPKVNCTVCLSISLPPQFPTCPPIFKITPKISHPWVDNNGLIIGHKKLGPNWNQHVSLANVTNEIIKELKADKPSMPQSSPQQSYAGINMNNSLGRMPNNPSYYYNRPPPPRPMMPPYGYPPMNMNMGPSFPTPMNNMNNSNNSINSINNINASVNNRNDVDLKDLDTLSLEELKEILNNEIKRRDYIHDKDKVKEMFNVREEMSLSNKTLAEKILLQKENFENLKSNLKEQQNTLRSEKEKFESLMKEQNKYVSNYTPVQLRSSLEQATAKADMESEEIANDFLSGMISADEFLKNYRKSRKLYHLRAEKLELFSVNQNTLFINK